MDIFGRKSKIVLTSATLIGLTVLGGGASRPAFADAYVTFGGSGTGGGHYFGTATVANPTSGSPTVTQMTATFSNLLVGGFSIDTVVVTASNIEHLNFLNSDQQLSGAPEFIYQTPIFSYGGIQFRVTALGDNFLRLTDKTGGNAPIQGFNSNVSYLGTTPQFETAVPEPSSIALFGLGLMGVAYAHSGTVTAIWPRACGC
eukprot:gene12376-12463_t